MRPRDIICPPQDVEPQVIVGRRRRTGSIFNTPTPTPSPNAVKMHHSDVGISPNQRPAEFVQQFPTLSPPQSAAALAFQFPDSPPTTDESADPGSPLSRARDVSASTTSLPIQDSHRSCSEGVPVIHPGEEFRTVWSGGNLWFSPAQRKGPPLSLSNTKAAANAFLPSSATIPCGPAVQLLQPTTIYVTGFPSTASERECGHVFRVIPGFQSLNLCRKKSRFPTGNEMHRPSEQDHVIVFGTFDSWFNAHAAIQYLRHYVVDPNLGATSAPLRATFAKLRSKTSCNSF